MKKLISIVAGACALVAAVSAGKAEAGLVNCTQDVNISMASTVKDAVYANGRVLALFENGDLRDYMGGNGSRDSRLVDTGVAAIGSGKTGGVEYTPLYVRNDGTFFKYRPGQVTFPEPLQSQFPNTTSLCSLDVSPVYNNGTVYFTQSNGTARALPSGTAQSFLGTGTVVECFGAYAPVQGTFNLNEQGRTVWLSASTGGPGFFNDYVKIGSSTIGKVLTFAADSPEVYPSTYGEARLGMAYVRTDYPNRVLYWVSGSSSYGSSSTANEGFGYGLTMTHKYNVQFNVKRLVFATRNRVALINEDSVGGMRSYREYACTWQ
jgi:hypothetical protein